MDMIPHRPEAAAGARWRALLVIGLLATAAGGWSVASWAQEHPTEHPTEHPKKAAEESASAPGVALEDVAVFIEQEVARRSEDGLLEVTDAKTGEELELKLDRVHRERLSQVGPDTFFVCADFKTANGSKVYDLDFFVTGSDPEELALQPDRTSIHKEDGKERYTWALDRKSGTWKQRPVDGSSPPATREPEEHPEHPEPR